MTTTYPFKVHEDEFKGKRVLVTGGTKGMGAATVRRFRMGGALVATTARTPAREESAVGATEVNATAASLFIAADAGTAAGVQEIIERIQQQWGGLDILINNVGGTPTKHGGFEVLNDED